MTKQDTLKTKRFIRWILKVVFLGIILFPLLFTMFLLVWICDDRTEFKEFFEIYKY